jgi:hypothetical protein
MFQNYLDKLQLQMIKLKESKCGALKCAFIYNHVNDTGKWK